MVRDRFQFRLMPVAATLAMLAGCQSYPTVVWNERPTGAPPAVREPQQPQPIIQNGYTEASNGYLKQGPVVAGALLSAPAQKIASEVAVELQKQNESLKAEKKELDERVEQLTKDLELNHQALTQANGEMEKAQKELGTTRTELQTWQHQLATLYSGFRTSEQQQSKTLVDMEQEIQRIIQSQQKQQETSQQAEPAPSEKAPSEKFESVDNAKPAAKEKPSTASAPTPPKS